MKWEGKSGGDFEQPPAGTHVARCIKVVDIGTQQGEYQGVPNAKRQCIITFELPNELMTGEHAGKPFITSKFYTASLGEKANLRKDLANWRGRDFTEEELNGFESKAIIDKGCMLSITLNDKGRARITGIMALPKGTQVPPRVNETVYFSLDEFDAGVYESLSDGIKKMISASPEYQRAIKPRPAAPAQKQTFEEAMEDDIPFSNPYRGKISYCY
tara:strand:- start:764 stop:1408 length:645 start_codon:yes stop_codon:yes gene_type:complete